MRGVRNCIKQNDTSMYDVSIRSMCTHQLPTFGCNSSCDFNSGMDFSICVGGWVGVQGCRCMCLFSFTVLWLHCV